MFSGGLPLVLPLVSIIFTITYWAEKWELLKLSRVPSPYAGDLAALTGSRICSLPTYGCSCDWLSDYCWSFWLPQVIVSVQLIAASECYCPSEQCCPQDCTARLLLVIVHGLIDRGTNAWYACKADADADA